ncbi:hypothetical protein HELRODRAFT_159024 [Helobdella robusta]|uniref:PDZ domain-containing protein n=1 Tax=Helobdella robusta TaxID=6412 RepID=T1ENH7_HELRO|nr:hypothetical protein HELRODRAFT_159024 [Helobdella robusta]ESO12482.1 hypothetical protein HELRODRAFT_159024 [Helobdella robusta]
MHKKFHQDMLASSRDIAFYVGVKVFSIDEGGVADCDGQLQEGDEIIEINDTSLYKMTFDRAQEIFRMAVKFPEINLKVRCARIKIISHSMKQAWNLKDLKHAINPAFTTKSSSVNDLMLDHWASNDDYLHHDVFIQKNRPHYRSVHSGSSHHGLFVYENDFLNTSLTRAVDKSLGQFDDDLEFREEPVDVVADCANELKPDKEKINEKKKLRKTKAHWWSRWIKSKNHEISAAKAKVEKKDESCQTIYSATGLKHNHPIDGHHNIKFVKNSAKNLKVNSHNLIESNHVKNSFASKSDKTSSDISKDLDVSAGSKKIIPLVHNSNYYLSKEDTVYKDLISVGGKNKDIIKKVNNNRNQPDCHVFEDIAVKHNPVEPAYSVIKINKDENIKFSNEHRSLFSGYVNHNNDDPFNLSSEIIFPNDNELSDYNKNQFMQQSQHNKLHQQISQTFDDKYDQLVKHNLQNAQTNQQRELTKEFKLKYLSDRSYESSPFFINSTSDASPDVSQQSVQQPQLLQQQQQHQQQYNQHQNQHQHSQQQQQRQQKFHLQEKLEIATSNFPADHQNRADQSRRFSQRVPNVSNLFQTNHDNIIMLKENGNQNEQFLSQIHSNIPQAYLSKSFNDLSQKRPNPFEKRLLSETTNYNHFDFDAPAFNLSHSNIYPNDHALYNCNKFCLNDRGKMLRHGSEKFGDKSITKNNTNNINHASSRSFDERNEKFRHVDMWLNKNLSVNQREQKMHRPNNVLLTRPLSQSVAGNLHTNMHAQYHPTANCFKNSHVDDNLGKYQMKQHFQWNNQPSNNQTIINPSANLFQQICNNNHYYEIKNNTCRDKFINGNEIKTFEQNKSNPLTEMQQMLKNSKHITNQYMPHVTDPRRRDENFQKVNYVPNKIDRPTMNSALLGPSQPQQRVGYREDSPVIHHSSQPKHGSQDFYIRQDTNTTYINHSSKTQNQSNAFIPSKPFNQRAQHPLLLHEHNTLQQTHEASSNARISQQLQQQHQQHQRQHQQKQQHQHQQQQHQQQQHQQHQQQRQQQQYSQVKELRDNFYQKNLTQLLNTNNVSNSII